MSKDVNFIKPRDTKSYIQLKTIASEIMPPEFKFKIGKENLLYHPPLFVRTVYTSMKNRSSKTPSSNRSYYVQHEMTMFLQHGNLFRDCDELEADVRRRLGVHQSRPTRCVYFDKILWIANLSTEAETLKHLDTSASLCAILCIATIVFGFISGGCGLFSNYTRLKAYTIASCLSLTAGFFLTLSIALFHGKCYTLRNMSLLPGHNIPLKDILETARVYSYGWSFFLAWICVFFCYISSFIWLYKSQGSRRYVINHTTSQKKKKVGSRVSVFSNYKRRIRKDIATV